MKINILAIEKYLPVNCVSSEELDKKVNGVIGRIEKNTGVKYRHQVSENETVAQMGANALIKSLDKANLKPSDIDLLIYSGASYDYPTPHNSAIIKSKITNDDVHFHCFDIDSTCLSFMNALDIAQLYLQTGRYKRIAIVNSEIASKALSIENEKIYGLFGDAAVAIILEASDSIGFKQSYINFKNYTSGALYANVALGGAVNRGLGIAATDSGFFFKMNGKGMMKLVKKHFDEFMKKIYVDSKMQLNDFDAIITHQASKFGNDFFQNTYKPDTHKVVETLSKYGNCISASIPLGLESLINNGFEMKNKKIILLGSGAGLSFGAIVLEF